MLSVLCGMVGGLSTVIHMWAVPRVFDLLLQYGLPTRVLNTVAVTMLFGLFLAAPAACGLYMARCCQHRGAVFWSGVLTGVGLVVGVWGGRAIIDPSSVGGGAVLWRLPVSIIAGGLVVGGTHTLIMLGYRRFVSTLVEDDGKTCVACAYDLSGAPSERCPECGTPRDTPMKPFGRIYRCAQFLDRQRKPLCLVLIVGLLGGATLFGLHHLQFIRFQAAFSSMPDEVIPSWTLYLDVDQTKAGCCYVAVPDDAAQRYIAVRFHKPEMLQAGVVKLFVGSLIPFGVPAGWAGVPQYLQFVEGEPQVHCTLDEVQTAQIIRAGIPPSLLEQLIGVADEKSWQAGDPNAPPSPDSAEVYVVDADPYFD